MISGPYDPYHPATEGMYFGLTEELEQLLSDVLAPIPIAFLVAGAGRIGKTSFLREIERRLDNDHLARAAYLDLNSLPLSSSPSPAQLFHSIARAVSSKLTGSNEEASSLTSFSDEPEAFDSLVNFIISLADKQSVPRVVVMLDELQLLNETEWLATVLRNFRAAMLDQEKGSRLAFLATASRENLGMEIPNPGVFVMRFKITSLRSLSEPEFRKMVREPIENNRYRLPIEVEDRIWEETGGHPFLVHWIMSRLWNMHDGDLSQSLDEHVSTPIQLSTEITLHFCSHLFSHFKPLEREIYRMLTETPDGLSRQEILDGLSISSQEINLSLKVLEQSGVVRSEGTRYACNGLIFKTWFAEQIRYQEVIEVTTEKGEKKQVIVTKPPLIVTDEDLRKFGIH